MKLNPIVMNVKGKRIILVDDSIVRGTTSGIIIRLLRNAGAKEIKMCISSPPVRFPCFFGIDTAQRRQLVAASHSEEEICKMIGADKLHYLSQKDWRNPFPAYGSKICVLPALTVIIPNRCRAADSTV